MDLRVLDQSYKRINSESEAYQVLRYLLKKQRLSGGGIRQDKRFALLGKLEYVTVGAYYRIRRTYSGLIAFDICGTHQISHLVDVARQKLLSLQNGEELAYFIDDIIAYFSDFSIEEKCAQYLLMYFQSGGSLEDVRMFGSIAEKQFEMVKKIGLEKITEESI
jgi:hypothetical protein